LASKTSAPFWLVRFKNFLLLLLRNRLAAVGLFLLLLFVVMALGAPYLTPYQSGGAPVSAQYNPPSWITLLNGPVGYSQNSQFSALTIRNPSNLAVVSNLQAYSVNLRFPSPSSGGIIQLTETLHYPYQGSPKQIFGSTSLLVPSTIAVPFNITTYVDRTDSAGSARFVFLPQTTVKNNGTFSGSFDSEGSLNQVLGLSQGFTAAQYVFAAEQADYQFVFQIGIPQGFTGTIDVSSFQLNLFGNTWGLFGTDDSGHDIYTEVIYGSRLSLEVGLVATSLGIGLGLLIGLLAGYLGRIVDEVLMRTADMLLVIPFLPLLIVLVATIGPNLLYIILLIGFFSWMGFARIIRSQVLSLRERPFIEAAKASGAGTGYITARHIFPNIVSLTYVNLALTVPGSIVTEAALSFLGLSDPTVITWGSMLGHAQEVGATVSNLAWWWIIPPGLSIALISLSFILLGYAMDELFNPRLRRRR